MSITYNGKSVLAIYRNGTAVEQALIAWNWTPRQLYFGGVRGAAYVPDASTVYGAGAEAVFGAGIATILDEKNGPPVIGPELVVNGTFINDASSWTIDAGSVAVIGGELAITSENSVAGRVYQIVPVVIGKRYIVKATIRNGTSTCRFRVGTSLNGLQYGAYTDSFNTIFTAITNEMHLTPQNGGTVGTSYHSNISVREIAENPATQSSTSPRPLLGRAPISRRNIYLGSDLLQGSTPTTVNGASIVRDGEGFGTTLTGTSDASYLQIAAPIISERTISFFAAARTASKVVVISTGSAITANFDLATGIATNGNNTTAATMTLVEDGYRCSFKALTSANLRLSPGAGSVNIGKLQIEDGDLTPYQSVSTNGVITTESGATSYPFIRLDLSDDTLITPGLGSTKNLTRFSEEFDNAAWIKVGTTVVGKRIAETTTTGQHIIYQASLTLPSATISVDAKADGRDWLRIALRSGGSAKAAYYNLATGEPGTVTLGLTSSIQPLGDGVYRCIVSGPTEANGSGFQIGTTTGDAIASHTGDGVSGIVIDRVQTEASSTATEYEYGGFKGTALVAGRNGTLVENVTLPDGNFTLGPTAVTSGAPALLRGVGDIVGYNLINKTLTPKERKYLIEYYKDRGAKGMLGPGGPELVTNGNFLTDTAGWTVQSGAMMSYDTSIFSDGGLLITANGANSSNAFQNIPGLIVGKIYILSAFVYTPSTNAATNYATIGIQSGSYTSLGSRAQLMTNTIENISIPFVATTTNQRIYTSVVTNNFLFWGTAGSSGYFDNISVKELRPEEEWV